MWVSTSTGGRLSPARNWPRPEKPLHPHPVTQPMALGCHMPSREAVWEGVCLSACEMMCARVLCGHVPGGRQGSPFLGRGVRVTPPGWEWPSPSVPSVWCPGARPWPSRVPAPGCPGPTRRMPGRWRRRSVQGPAQPSPRQCGGEGHLSHGRSTWHHSGACGPVRRPGRGLPGAAGGHTRAVPLHQPDSTGGPRRAVGRGQTR